MDDIAGKINNILNDKESMEQIMQIAQSLGFSGNEQQKETGNQASSGEENQKDMSKILSDVMGAMGNNSSSDSPQSESKTGLDIGMLIKIQQAMATYNQNNKNVELLRALKPHFGEERQKKVDDAIKLMQLTNMLPLLKQTGLFSFLGGEEKAEG